jgi:hypothetical protein
LNVFLLDVPFGTEAEDTIQSRFIRKDGRLLSRDQTEYDTPLMKGASRSMTISILGIDMVKAAMSHDICNDCALLSNWARDTATDFSVSEM